MVWASVTSKVLGGVIAREEIAQLELIHWVKGVDPEFDVGNEEF